MKIYDCFMFSSELEILELRMRELENAVDHFVIVEATRTHSGLEKPLNFAAARDRFSRWNDKIIYLPVFDLPMTGNPWDAENAQRNEIVRGIDKADPCDIIIISDADEIPRASCVAAMREDHRVGLWSLKMPLFYVKYNNFCISGTCHIPWSVAYRAGLFPNPQGARGGRGNNWLPRTSPWAEFKQINHAGWHFSYIGDDAAVKAKIAAFAHQEFNTQEVIDAINVDGMIASGKDILGRDGWHWKAVDLTDYFPEYLFKNQNLFQHNIASVTTNQVQ